MEMNGKVFVHIGLPKTATTTLQIDYFPNLQSERIKYIGVYQPRHSKQTDEYKTFCDAVNTGGGIDKIRQELMNMCNRCEVIVVSEEMFLVSEKKTRWRTKLANLSRILEGFDYKIIVTVREPISAMFSYYVERYGIFLAKGKSFIELAKNDEMMEIYHYGKLTTALFKYFKPEKIYIKKFEDLVAGEGPEALTRLIVTDGSCKKSFKLNNHNTKNVTSQGVYADIKSTFTYKFDLETLSVWVRRIFFPAVNLLHGSKINDKELVVKPTQNEINELKRHLKMENEALNKLFKIKYD